MMRSLYSGVAGLKSHQTGMDVVGNNIANVNTTGFKSFRTTYKDTLFQTNSGASAPMENKGGTNPMQVGLGSGVASIDRMIKDGSVQTTSSNTDLCLSGNGMFIVKDNSGTYYTRNGAFSFDGEGNFVNTAGQYVMGWTGSGGEVNTNAEPGRINIESGKPMAAKATTLASYTKNLNAAVPLIKDMSQGGAPVTNATATTADPVTVTLTDGTTQTLTEGTYVKGFSLPLTTSISAYDSLGNNYTIPVLVAKTDANSNTWRMYIIDKDGNWGTNTLYAENGTTPRATLLMDNITMTFTPSGAYSTGAGSIKITPIGDGAAAPFTVSIDLSGLTQYAGSNTINAATDGNEAGVLTELNVDSAGTITGTYSNGINQREATVALAQFNNMAGLTAKGNSLFIESNNSGEPNIKTATDLGVTITPSALEMSNVDLANEFSTMIITQRGFQSNSKVITVSDEMLDTLINMKR